MKTEYIPLHTAINWFENYKLEKMNQLLTIYGHIPYYKDGILVSSPEQGRMKFPKELANFLFYIEHNILRLGTKTINGLSLYGSHIKTPDDMIKIDSKNIIFFYDINNYDLYELGNKYYIVNNYNYFERYCEDFNYAALQDALTRKIKYIYLSIKYDEFLDLIKKLDNYMEEDFEFLLKYTNADTFKDVFYRYVGIKELRKINEKESRRSNEN